MSNVTVVNKYRTNKPFIYIGRGSPFGNPFPMEDKSISERDRVCDLYTHTVLLPAMESNQASPLKDAVNTLIDKVNAGEEIVLGCFCKPQRCHGDAIKEYIDNHTSTIKEFKGSNRFLSNFYPLDTAILDSDNLVYTTTEHYFMSRKTLDTSVRSEIANAVTPSQAKKLGRKLKLRPNWDTIKYDVMLTALRFKFGPHNPRLAKLLIATGSAELIEGNYWNDKIWGVCLKTNTGQNNLGKLLMLVRSEIANKS